MDRRKLQLQLKLKRQLKMNVNDIYATESNYIKAEHLTAGQEVPVTISGFEMVELDNKKKVCLKFQGKEKGLVLNKTNAVTISTVYGNDCNLWVGKPIFIFSTKVDYGGQMVDGIRVRVQLQTASVDQYIPGFDKQPQQAPAPQPVSTEQKYESSYSAQQAEASMEMPNDDVPF